MKKFETINVLQSAGNDTQQYPYLLAIWKELCRITQTAQFTGRFVLESVMVEHDDAAKTFRLVATDSRRLLMATIPYAAFGNDPLPLEPGRYDFAGKPGRLCGLSLVYRDAGLEYPNYKEKTLAKLTNLVPRGEYHVQGEEQFLFLTGGALNLNMTLLPNIAQVRPWRVSVQEAVKSACGHSGELIVFDGSVCEWEIRYILMSSIKM